MRERQLSIPGRIVIAGARVALGLGLGLWLSRKVHRDVRIGSAGALLAVNNTINVINTFPITVINKFPINVAMKPDSQEEHPAA